MEMSKQQWADLALRAGQVFKPYTPIDRRFLFSGRTAQIRRLVDVVNQTGQHAVIFGERGVGKTSLANVLTEFLASPNDQPVLAPRINCDSGDTLDSIWRKLLQQIELIRTRPSGFIGNAETPYNSAELLGDGAATPHAVTRALTIMSRDVVPIMILDEFDRLGQKPRRGIADTIKSLSDGAVAATIVVVGVSDSVEELITEHQSVSRAIKQIQMPRMIPDEIREIMIAGLSQLEMDATEEALDRVVLTAQGLPHYTHLVGLHASRVAIDQKRMEVSLPMVDTAIKGAIEDAQQSVRVAYHEAIRSARKDNLFSDVLLACALATTDELGYFAAQDVREPINKITGKAYDIPSFAQHLNDFSDNKRGNILHKTGVSRRFRFRFSDPLMQPFVIMNGIVAGKIPENYQKPVIRSGFGF